MRREWRQRMNSNGAFKRIKKGLFRIPNSIFLVGDESTGSATIGEVLHCLRHWRRIWDRSPVRWEDVQDAYSLPANCTYIWKCLESGELAAAAKSQAGKAAGLDGWSGDELDAFPPKLLANASPSCYAYGSPEQLKAIAILFRWTEDVSHKCTFPRLLLHDNAVRQLQCPVRTCGRFRSNARVGE